MNKKLVFALITIIILTILLTLFAFAFVLGKESTDNSSDTSTSQDTDKNDNDDGGEDNEAEEVTGNISKPTLNSTLEGEFEVSGSLQNVGESKDFSIYVFDSENTFLGKTDFSVEGTSFTENVFISYYPATDKGIIQLRQSGSDEVLAKVDVKFKSLEKADVLKIYSPIQNQLIQKTRYEERDEYILNLRGEMKGIFEGTLNFKIVNESEEIILEDFVMASGDNYENFARFSKVFNFTIDESLVTDNVNLVFYEISSKDGREVIILEMPLYLE